MILSIAQHLYSVLKADSTLAGYVSTRIYPIATKTEVDFPFIVYERDSVDVEYDKAQRRYASVGATVYVLAEKYEDSLTIAERVAVLLDKHLASYSGFDVIDAHITGAVESYVEQTFIQQLTFNFQIKENNG